MSARRPRTRDLVLKCIRAYPGIHLRGIERELGLSSALVHYHVKALEREGLVSSAAMGGYLRFFPLGESGRLPNLTERDAEMLAVLREEVPLHVVLILLEGGPLPQAHLVDELGLAKSTVTYHLQRLEERGLVRRDEKRGQNVIHLREPKRVERILLRYEPPSRLLDGFRDLWEAFYD